MALCCNYCGAKQAKLKCSQCKTAYYCNIKCQKSNWKKHKHECKLLLPNSPNVEKSSIKTDEFEFMSMHTTKDMRQKFSHDVAYTSLTNTQCMPCKTNIRLFTDILLSPLTFWNIQSIHIQFIHPSENLSISPLVIRNFFYVASKLPKLKQFYIQDMTCGEVIPDTFNIRKGYIESFHTGAYQSLNELFIPIDDVFSSKIDYSAFCLFIENAPNITTVNITIRYWIPQQRDYILFCESMQNLFISLCKRKSIEKLSFVIDDCQCIDTVDEAFTDLLFILLEMIFSTHSDLSILTFDPPSFSKPKQDILWRILANKLSNLRELIVNKFAVRPYEYPESMQNYDDILKLIAAQKQMEYVSLDGYICWSLCDLKKLVNTLNKQCKSFQFLGCGWIQFESLDVVNHWKVLMTLFENPNMSLLDFQPWPFLQSNRGRMHQFDLLPDEVVDIICNAVVKCVLRFNDFMVKSEVIMSGHLEGQKVIIDEIFQYLVDDDLKNEIIIRINCPIGEYAPYKSKWSSKAIRIKHCVNERIKQMKHEKQLRYVKTFDFRIHPNIDFSFMTNN
eukprot:15315_1